MRGFFIGLLTLAAAAVCIYGFFALIFLVIVLIIQIYRWIFLYKKPSPFYKVNISRSKNSINH